MNLIDRRLKRLEAVFKVRRDAMAKPEPAMSVFDRINAYVAYAKGQGPRPPRTPCPRWLDPAEWAERLEAGERRLEQLCREYEAVAAASSEGECGDTLPAPGLDDAAVE